MTTGRTENDRYCGDVLTKIKIKIIIKIIFQNLNLQLALILEKKHKLK